MTLAVLRPVDAGQRPARHRQARERTAVRGPGIARPLGSHRIRRLGNAAAGRRQVARHGRVVRPPRQPRVCRRAAAPAGGHQPDVERGEIHAARRPHRRQPGAAQRVGDVDGPRLGRRRAETCPGPAGREVLPRRQRDLGRRGRDRSRSSSRAADRRAGGRTCLVRVGRRATFAFTLPAMAAEKEGT